MDYILSKRKPEIGDKGFIVGDRFIVTMQSNKNPLLDQYTKFLVCGEYGIIDLACDTPIQNHGLVSDKQFIIGDTGNYAVIKANTFSEDIMCPNKPWTLQIAFQNRRMIPKTGASSALIGHNTSDNHRFDFVINSNPGFWIGIPEPNVSGTIDLGYDFHVFTFIHYQNNNVDVYLDNVKKGSMNIGSRNQREYDLGFASDIGFQYGVRYAYPYDIKYLRISNIVREL